MEIAQDSSSARSRNYLSRHWRGELPLARSYWINAVALNLAIRLILFAVVGPSAERLPPYLILVCITLFWIFLAGVLTWELVGVARSANRHAVQTGAATTTILAWLGIVAIGGSALTGFLKTGVPQIADLVQIVRGDPQWPDPVITVLPTGREIEFFGRIKFGSATKLERMLDEHHGIRLLQLDTGGGWEHEALAMAAVIRRHNLDTYVGLNCASAGILVFLAGKERILRDNAKVGFHMWRAAGLGDNAVVDQQVNLLMAAGANTAFTQHVIDTPSDSMWYPTPQEIADQGLATRITDGSGHSLGSREIAHYNFLGLKEELLGKPQFRALSKMRSNAFDRAIEYAVGSIANGNDMGSSLREVTALLATATKNAYTCASNEALDDCLDLNIEILKRNMYQAPKETLLVLWQKMPKGSVPDYPYEADSRYIEALLESPLMPVAAGDASQADRDAKELLLKSGSDRDIKKLFAGVPEDRLDQIALCEVMNDYLAAIKALPPERRYPVIRLNYGLGLKLAPDGRARQSKQILPFQDLRLAPAPSS